MFCAPDRKVYIQGDSSAKPISSVALEEVFADYCTFSGLDLFDASSHFGTDMCKPQLTNPPGTF